MFHEGTYLAMADGSFVAATNEEGDWESLLKIGFRTLAYIMLQFCVLRSASSGKFLKFCQNILDLICLSMLIYAQ